MLRKILIILSIRIPQIKNHQLAHQKHVSQDHIPGLTCAHSPQPRLTHAIRLARRVADKVVSGDDGVVGFSI